MSIKFRFFSFNLEARVARPRAIDRLRKSVLSDELPLVKENGLRLARLTQFARGEPAAPARQGRRENDGEVCAVSLLNRLPTHGEGGALSKRAAIIIGYKVMPTRLTYTSLRSTPDRATRRDGAALRSRARELNERMFSPPDFLAGV